MTRCPSCGSDRVCRSGSRDHLLYRLLGMMRMRCHTCFEKFTVSWWAGREVSNRFSRERGAKAA